MSEYNDRTMIDGDAELTIEMYFKANLAGDIEVKDLYLSRGSGMKYISKYIKSKFKNSAGQTLEDFILSEMGIDFAKEMFDKEER